MPHTLSKKERLCGERKISHLFDNGVSGFTYPFRYIYLEQECTTGTVGTMNKSDIVDCDCSGDSDRGDDCDSDRGDGGDVPSQLKLDNGSMTRIQTESDTGKKRVFMPIEEGISVLVSVSKRYHKRANKRNLIKRRMREAYRQNNDPLKHCPSISGKHLSLALIYSSKEVVEYKTIENAIKKIITALSEGL